MLQVSASPVVNPVLEVGQVTEQVEVRRTPPSLKHEQRESALFRERPYSGYAFKWTRCRRVVALSGAATPAPLNNGSGGIICAS